MLRQAARRSLTIRRGEFLTVPSTSVAVPDPGFVCQDFSGAVTVETYGGTNLVETHGGSITVESYGGAVTVESYGGTATNCGR